MPWVLWQIHTLGHTCTGSCICNKDERGSLKVDPGCRVKGHSGQVYSTLFSPDGKRVVSGSLDGLVKICDSETGEEVSTFVGVR